MRWTPICLVLSAIACNGSDERPAKTDPSTSETTPPTGTTPTGTAPTDTTPTDTTPTDTTDPIVDEDGDGYPQDLDCDDTDPAVNPGATEAEYDGIDNDCDPTTPDDDLDGDGHGFLDDCDDTDAAISPTEAETPYDGVDNDCSPATPDDDLDGDGDPVATDCDDAEPLSSSIGTETPYDGLDNDCDPATPDDDLDGDGYTILIDCLDTDPTVNPGGSEVPYDGLDNDCDPATVDDDLDGDGHPILTDCDDADPAVHPFAIEIPYDGVDNDCSATTPDDDLDGDGFGIAWDCDDSDPAVFTEPSGICAIGTSCRDGLEDGRATTTGLYYIDFDGPRNGEAPILADCDMDTDGGGWTLVFHMYDMAGLNEDQFVAEVGHDQFTEADWTYDGATVQAGATSGVQKIWNQGALDVNRFANDWDDLRMTCSTWDGDPIEEEYVQIDGYATANGSNSLLGAAPNGTSYAVDPTLNTMGLSTVWHDNELDGINSNHYLCDTADGGANGTTQFGFCYTDFLNDPNTSDQGDSIVSIGFGTQAGADGFSDGFTLECGDMAGTALQNAGTVSIWIR